MGSSTQPALAQQSASSIVIMSVFSLHDSLICSRFRLAINPNAESLENGSVHLLLCEGESAKASPNLVFLRNSVKIAPDIGSTT